MEISGAALAADLGIALDGSAWLEITVSRTHALALDYAALAAQTILTVYGAQDDLVDFFNEEMLPAETIDKIRRSDEVQVHLCFRLTSADASGVQALMGYLTDQRVITAPIQ